MAVSFKYGAEAFAMVGIAYGLIKWVGRNVRSLVSDSRVEEAHMEALAASIPSAAADALVRQGLVSAADLARMTPRERVLLAAAGRRLDAAADRKRAPQATPRSSDAVGAAATPRAPAATPRLHLITPSRPPLGITVHCPGCGIAVDREALQRIGSTTCPRCKRPISAHIQRGRLTVIVEETPEETEHRKRMDGGHD
jgi:Zn-finger nucleic acid-binding protein